MIRLYTHMCEYLLWLKTGFSIFFQILSDRHIHMTYNVLAHRNEQFMSCFIFPYDVLHCLSIFFVFWMCVYISIYIYLYIGIVLENKRLYPFVMVMIVSFSALATHWLNFKIFSWLFNLDLQTQAVQIRT